MDITATGAGAVSAACPEDVGRQAIELGFSVPAWDEEGAALIGNSQQFVGSPAEVRAYLIAWAACRSAILTERLIEAERGRIQHTCLALVSRQAIEPNQTVQITARLQCSVFRGDRVAIPDALAPHFWIDDIKVGPRSTFPQAQSMPGDLFACRLEGQQILIARADREGGMIKIEIEEPTFAEFGRAWSMPPCLTAMEVTVYATNRSEQPRLFEMLILGRAVYG